MIEQIDKEKKRIGPAYAIDKQLFYVRFHERFDTIKKDIGTCIKNLIHAFDSLHKQSNVRKNSLLIAREYAPITDPPENFQRMLNDLEALRLEANEFTDKLHEEQINARRALRLLEDPDQFSALLNSIGKIPESEGSTCEV